MSSIGFPGFTMSHAHIFEKYPAPASHAHMQSGYPGPGSHLPPELGRLLTHLNLIEILADVVDVDSAVIGQPAFPKELIPWLRVF